MRLTLMHWWVGSGREQHLALSMVSCSIDRRTTPKRNSERDSVREREEERRNERSCSVRNLMRRIIKVVLVDYFLKISLSHSLSFFAVPPEPITFYINIHKFLEEEPFFPSPSSRSTLVRNLQGSNFPNVDPFIDREHEKSNIFALNG